LNPPCLSGVWVRAVDLKYPEFSETAADDFIIGDLRVRGPRSDNRLIREKLGWEPTGTLIDGIDKTYAWIEKQVFRNNKPIAAPAQAAE
jgi:nucleoside-diphosphate-sugar epimerase